MEYKISAVVSLFTSIFDVEILCNVPVFIPVVNHFVFSLNGRFVQFRDGEAQVRESEFANLFIRILKVKQI